VAYHTTPKMAKRKEAYRARILHAAIHLFGKLGYHATTVPRIVRQSGSSIGAFYFYFRNKEDVFAAALEAIGEQIAAALNKAIAAAGDSTLTQMRAAVQGLVIYLSQHPAEARILIVESSGLTSRLANIRRSIIASHCRSVERVLASIPHLSPGSTRFWHCSAGDFSRWCRHRDSARPAKPLERPALRRLGFSPCRWVRWRR